MYLPCNIGPCPPIWHHSTAVHKVCPYMVILSVRWWRVGSVLNEDALASPLFPICMLFIQYMAGVLCTSKYSNTGLFLKLSSLNMNKFKNRWSGHIELLKMYWMYNILNTPERGYTVWVFYNSNAFLYLASSCWSSATASRQEMRQERGDIR